MAAREIGFGLYDVRRPATSPTRKSGAAKGRPQPRGLRSGGSASQPALTPSPPRAVPASASTTAVAAASSSFHSPVRPAAAAAYTTSPSTSRVLSGPRAPAQRTGGESASASALPNSPAPQLAPIAHGATVTYASASSAYLENYFRYLVHLTGASVLLPSLLDILHHVLRLLQHDRAQQKGQQPCRRHSSLTGGDVEGEVTGCLTQAAQAPSLSAAAHILETFLVEHEAATSPISTSPPLTSFAAATCSPVVLVGATLAELHFSGRAVASAVRPSALLAYLDAAVAAGHPGAMLCVGVCLRDGCGGAVTQDVPAGLAWLRCAAAAGYLPAMHELGETYEVGVAQSQVVPCATSSTSAVGDEEDVADCVDALMDWGEAMRWYRQAAEAGYAPAQLDLGKLLLLAAEQGGQEATTSRGDVDHLKAEAKRWLQACAAAGVEESVRLLKRMK